LSDRISDPRGFETPWSKNTQLKTRDVETMQQTLTRLGLYKTRSTASRMLTRAALGTIRKPIGSRSIAGDDGSARSHAAEVRP